ncbi:MAG: hypothetical protein LBR10_08250, partial [Prevotellaceae bacterium]|nr:hypothetical protein [Prevotellaceae bacterium]
MGQTAGGQTLTGRPTLTGFETLWVYSKMSFFNSTSQSSLFVKTVTNPPVSDVQNSYGLMQLI